MTFGWLSPSDSYVLTCAHEPGARVDPLETDSADVCLGATVT